MISSDAWMRGSVPWEGFVFPLLMIIMTEGNNADHLSPLIIFSPGLRLKKRNLGRENERKELVLQVWRVEEDASFEETEGKMTRRGGLKKSVQPESEENHSKDNDGEDDDDAPLQQVVWDEMVFFAPFLSLVMFFIFSAWMHSGIRSQSSSLQF